MEGRGRIVYLCSKTKAKKKKYTRNFGLSVSFKNEHSQFQTQAVKINVYPISQHQFSNFPAATVLNLCLD